MNSKQLKKTKKINLQFELENFYLLENASINYELQKFKTGNDIEKHLALQNIGAELGAVLHAVKYAPDLVISIPRGGRAISRAIAKLLEVREVESNQGKNKSPGPLTKDFSCADLHEILLVDALIDQGNTIIELINELKVNCAENFSGIKIKVVAVFIAFDAIAKINAIFPEVELYAAQIASKISWIRDDTAKFKRIIADLPDIGDLVENFNFAN